MGFLNAVKEFIVYTATDAPYRTNPQTGQRYSYDQMGTFAEQTAKQYSMAQYQTNPYIAPDRPAIAIA